MSRAEYKFAEELLPGFFMIDLDNPGGKYSS